MSRLSLYSIYHVNLLYSSVEIERRVEVIQQCLYPLLKLAENGLYKIAIEAPSQSLEIIQALDPQWITKLKTLIQAGKIEFVGAGHVQLIGPLVPDYVNDWNLEVGKKVYKELLGVVPNVWLLNEQAFSKGLIQSYLKAGIKNIVMEFNNPYSYQAEIKQEDLYSPKSTKDDQGREIQILWNDSMTFQKFQRVIHNEIQSEELEAYLHDHSEKAMNVEEASLCLYGNDAEIFDFRPGRFATEPGMSSEPHEWRKVEELYKRLNSKFNFKFPSEVIDTTKSFKSLSVTSLDCPIPVKKQIKYNATRWSLTGRGSPFVNQRCFELAAFLFEKGATETQKKTLCELWSSDYRTHLTEKRWQGYLTDLQKFEDSCGFTKKPMKAVSAGDSNLVPQGHFLQIKNPQMELKLNMSKGLTLESCRLGKALPMGRVPHGFYRDIRYGVDWFSHTVTVHQPSKPQVTDLKACRSWKAQTSVATLVGTEIETTLGSVKKTYEISQTESQYSLTYEFNWPEVPVAAARLALVSVCPEAWDLDTLNIKTHNGGVDLETFDFKNIKRAFFSDAPTCAVSSMMALGMTKNVIELSDKNTVLTMKIESEKIRPLPMVEYESFGDTYFLRLLLSLCEYDETRKGTFDFRDAKVRIHFQIRSVHA